MEYIAVSWSISLQMNTVYFQFLAVHPMGNSN